MGEDVFSPHYQERAYIATYQDLGYIRNNTLTIISPMRKVKQYLLETSAEQPSKENPIFFNEKQKKILIRTLKKKLSVPINRLHIGFRKKCSIDDKIKRDLFLSLFLFFTTLYEKYFVPISQYIVFLLTKRKSL